MKTCSRGVEPSSLVPLTSQFWRTQHNHPHACAPVPTPVWHETLDRSTRHIHAPLVFPERGCSIVPFLLPVGRQKMSATNLRSEHSHSIYTKNRIQKYRTVYRKFYCIQTILLCMFLWTKVTELTAKCNQCIFLMCKNVLGVCGAKQHTKKNGRW